jgi:hypothetical protein
MILARVAVAKSSRSAASSEDLSGTFYRACRKTAPRTGAVSSLSDLCSPHDAYAPCPLLAGQRLVSHRLRSGDLCIPASETYGDYRDQLVPWESYRRQIATYAEQAGLPATPMAIVTGLREQLAMRAAAVDAAFPANEHVEIVGL